MNRLKPMRIGEIFDNIFFVTRRNLKAMVNLHVVLFLPLLTLVALVTAALFFLFRANPFLLKQFTTPGSAMMIGGTLLLIFGGIGLFFLAMALMFVNMYGIYRIFQSGLEGGSITWRQSLKGSLRGALYIFIASIVVSTVSSIITIPLGLLRIISPWFVVPQLIVSYGLQIFALIAFPLVALEDIDPIRAIWRSCKLVWFNFWRTVGIYLLFFLITMVAYGLALIICFIPFIVLFTVNDISLHSAPDWTIFLDPWFIVTSIVAVIILFSLGFVFFMAGFGLQVMLMNDLRMRSEGYDLLTEVHEEGTVHH